MRQVRVERPLLPAQTDDARGHFGNGPVEKESEEETSIGARRHSGMAARRAEQITANGRFMLPGKEGEAPNEAEGGHAMIGREGGREKIREWVIECSATL